MVHVVRDDVSDAAAERLFDRRIVQEIGESPIPIAAIGNSAS
jgi:hypothetical protein